MHKLPPLPGVDEQTFLREREANHFVRERHDLNAAPRVTLPGLYEVPWGSMQEAYGPAYFVPYYISALSSPDEGDRMWGLEALWASINHQGHPDEASPHVVPFLLALLDAPELPDREVVVMFTIELAVGEARWCYEAGSDVDGFHHTNCYDAVAAGAEIIGRHLGHEDASVRAEALRGCGLVAALDRFIDTVKEMAGQDPDRGVRLTARLALGCMARRTGHDVAAWLRRRDPPEDRWERAVHAAALAYALGSGVSDSERESLQKLGSSMPTDEEIAYGEADDPEDRPENLKWDVVNTLRHQYVTVSVPPTAEQQIVRLEQGVMDEVAIECARRAAAALLPQEASEPNVPWQWASLSALSRRLLRRLAEDETLYTRTFPYAHSAPTQMPRRLEHVLRWTGAKTGPLNAAVTTGGVTRPLWLATYELLTDQLTGDDWKRAAESSGQDRVAVVEDLLENMDWITHLARFREMPWEQRNDATSTLLIALGSWLAEAPHGVAWAQEKAEALRGADRPAATEELTVALSLGLAAENAASSLSEEHVGLLNLEHAPVSVFAKALGRAVATLGRARAERFIEGVPMYRISMTTQETRDEETNEITERVECRYIYFLPFWGMLPQLKSVAAVKKIMDARVAYEEHRAEHGSRVERLRFRGSDDQPYPMGLALATIQAADSEARDVVETYRGRVSDEFLDQALDHLRG